MCNNKGDDRKMVDTSIPEVNLSIVSERKFETIGNSEPTFDEKSITVIELLIWIYLQLMVLGCPFCKNTSINLPEDYEKKKKKKIGIIVNY